MAVELLPDEEAMFDSLGRCDVCGHLNALHNDHCCEFCMVPDCACEWGEIHVPYKYVPGVGDADG